MNLYNRKFTSTEVMAKVMTDNYCKAHIDREIKRAEEACLKEAILALPKIPISGRKYPVEYLISKLYKDNPEIFGKEILQQTPNTQFLSSPSNITRLLNTKLRLDYRSAIEKFKDYYSIYGFPLTCLDLPNHTIAFGDLEKFGKHLPVKFNEKTLTYKVSYKVTNPKALVAASLNF